MYRTEEEKKDGPTNRISVGIPLGKVLVDEQEEDGRILLR
jgi:hypothetical protein